jgi:hypothetical protein
MGHSRGHGLYGLYGLLSSLKKLRTKRNLHIHPNPRMYILSTDKDSKMNTDHTSPEFISQVRESEILFYLVSNETQSLTYLVHTLLEQGYTASEISQSLKDYIERQV